MNNNYPKVSIIIPVYNRENIIQETLNCAVKQTYKNIEIIVSDNCSTDNTYSIIEKYAQEDARIKIFKTETNLGPVLNWKNCIDHVTGEYIKILWSDDLISLDFIEKSLLLFDSETAFVISALKIFDSETKEILSTSKYQQVTNYLSVDYLEDALIYNKFEFPVSPGCALFRSSDIKSSFIEEIPNPEGLIFKKYGAGNDLLFFLITANKYKYVKVLPEYAAFFRHHKGSITVTNPLDLYYEYSKFFFIEKYKTNLLPIYTSKIFFNKIKHGNGYSRLLNIFNNHPFKIKNIFAKFEYLATKIKYKLL